MIAKIVFSTSYFIKENPGSTEAQISILTGKVARLTSHLKIHNKALKIMDVILLSKV